MISLLKYFIKKVVASMVYPFRNKLLQSRIKEEEALIIMYHHILPASMIDRIIQPGMYVEVNSFEMQLKFLKEHFVCISLESYYRLCNQKRGRNNLKPVAVLTFDDGWLDFYQYAYPLLQKYKIPATVFLPTNYIGSNNFFWTDRLASLLLNSLETKKVNNKRETSATSLLTAQIEKIDGNFEEMLEGSIQLLKKRRLEEIEDVLSELSHKNNGNNMHRQARAFISWEEVHKMYESGLISFGSHTANHPILTTLKINEVGKELEESKVSLLKEEVITRTFESFCYPNGNYDNAVSEMVKQKGYSIAVTTKKGWSNLKSNDFFKLNRTGIHQDISYSQKLFFARIIGVL